MNQYMGWPWQPEKLLSKDELLEELKSGGETDRAMASIRHYEEEIAGQELMWWYPISLGSCAGAFIVPVKEGVLCVPYDEMDREKGDFPLLAEAVATGNVNVRSGPGTSYTRIGKLKKAQIISVVSVSGRGQTIAVCSMRPIP